MINLLTNLLYHVSSWVIVFVVLSWLIANFYPLMSRMLAKVHVEQAALCILLYGLLAPVAASATLIILLLPDFAFALVADHCHGLDCAPHRLQVTLSTVYAVAKVFFLVILLISVCTMIALQLFSGRNKLRTLDSLAESTPSSYKVLDSETALAWCHGLVKPKIFISRGLAETLTKEQIQVVLAHEQTHVKRKDNLRKWALHWATIAWPKRVRTQIKQELSDYTEHVCDLIAVRCQRERASIIAAMETLKQCCCSVDNEERSESAKDYTVRADMLKKAWDSTKDKSNNTTVTYWMPTLFMSSIWLIAVILAVYAGHPILEWVAA